MLLISGKCYYLLTDKDITNKSVELGKKTLLTEAEQRHLGIIKVKDLNF